jgi:hypothetical protein
MARKNAEGAADQPEDGIAAEVASTAMLTPAQLEADIRKNVVLAILATGIGVPSPEAVKQIADAADTLTNRILGKKG